MTQIIFRPIRQRLGYPNFINVMKEVEKTFDDKVKPELRSYFTRITDLWDHRVDWKTRKRVTRERISLHVYPSGPNAKLWLWITLGTKEREIVPRGPGYPLRFRVGYKARTGRGYRYRGPGKATGPWVSTYRVKKHRIKPRHFEKHIKRFYTPKFHARMRNALRRGARKL